MGWSFEPGTVAGLLSLTVAYGLAATRYRGALVRLGGPPPRWLPPGAMSRERPGHLGPAQVVSFYAGIMVAALALLSPLHTLGERYLLSAHMVQHLIITLAVPPLLLMGTPGWMLRPALRVPAVRRLARSLLTPVPTFVTFNLVLLFWHAPALYNLALTVPVLHGIEHAMFLALGLVTWWPVLGPLPEVPRLPYGGQVLYLFFQSLPPTALGAIIALARGPIYPTYWAAERVSGFLGFTSLTPFQDQQLAGLIMWIPGALGYFLALSIVFFLWLEHRSVTDSPPYGSVNPDRAKSHLSAR